MSGGPGESARKVRIADLSIGRDAELVGPIMALLNNVASLHHAVRMYPTALGLGHLDYAGLQDFLARVTDGSAQVARRLRLAIGSLDVCSTAQSLTRRDYSCSNIASLRLRMTFCDTTWRHHKETSISTEMATIYLTFSKLNQEPKRKRVEFPAPTINEPIRHHAVERLFRDQGRSVGSTT